MVGGGGRAVSRNGQAISRAPTVPDPLTTSKTGEAFAFRRGVAVTKTKADGVSCLIVSGHGVQGGSKIGGKTTVNSAIIAFCG